MKQIGELEIIELIKKSFSVKGSSLVTTGIGDDCASIKPPKGKELLLTTDTLTENLHFRLKWTTAEKLGRKSVAVNLSDIAAMGGTPHTALLSMTISGKVDGKWVKAYLKGVKKEFSNFGVRLIGGNVSGGSALSFTVTVIGSVSPKLKILRSGAKAGDSIFVTGSPGDSALGFDILKSGKGVKERGERKLVDRHLLPSPRVLWADVIAKNGCASSMIDISDGVLLDLKRIVSASNVSAVIDLSHFPLSREAKKIVMQKGARGWKRILGGGEDYELLFTVPRGRLKRVESLVASGEISATKIGEIVKKDGSESKVDVTGVNGKIFRVSDFGFRH